jgi:hypothetical protein
MAPHRYLLSYSRGEEFCKFSILSFGRCVVCVLVKNTRRVSGALF